MSVLKTMEFDGGNLLVVLGTLASAFYSVRLKKVGTVILTPLRLSLMPFLVRFSSPIFYFSSVCSTKIL